MTPLQSQDDHQRLYDDRYSGDYMDIDNYSEWTHHGPTALKVRETLVEVPIKPRAVLDFGCGVGKWIGLLSGMYPDAKISGVDVSATAIGKARQRYPRCDFSAFNGSLTPYPDKSFDLIFSFHVLEHVQSIEDSIKEISRLLDQGGFACIIFPCGNRNSLQDMLMRRMQGGIVSSEDGRSVHFFEIQDGHLRRMTSADTIKLFNDNGLKLAGEFYAAQIFGWIDWLCRGTGPGYIKSMFILEPKNLGSALFVYPIERSLLGLNWIIRKKDVDLAARRNFIKHSLVFIMKYFAIAIDKLVGRLSTLEWQYFRKRKNGSAQYLLFTRA